MILLHAPVATKVEEMFYFIEVQEAEYACPIIALRFKTRGQKSYEEVILGPIFGCLI